MMDARPIRLPAATPPMLVVVVDTEEEFDWGAAFDRANVGVSHLREVWRLQAVCEDFGIRPTYVVDYPIASQEECESTLKPLVAEGRALVGAHLHPWVNPPFEEVVSPRNSYPGNLPPALERRKLELLAETIEQRFGARPSAYKAGRYGIGPATSGILAELGFRIDLSICPAFDFRGDGGPDFSAATAHPYWFGNGEPILELPATAGFIGYLRPAGALLHRAATRPALRAIKLEGVLGKLRALARIRLSPEGYDFADTRALTEALMEDGLRIFSLTLHSPSMKPGCTPYVRSEAELQAFLQHIRRYLEYFVHERGGVPTTPQEVRDRLLETALAGTR